LNLESYPLFRFVFFNEWNFKLNNVDYRDYRPSLNALAKALKIDLEFEETEDQSWYGIDSKQANKWIPSSGIHSFNIGGYYVIREPETLTFIRCGNHKDRPSQADNLHVDIWYKGDNILYDGGSYRYNTTPDLLNYFMGTTSHNTVMIGEYSQMKKGSRFIWFNWSQSLFTKTMQTDDSFIFEGEISVFTYLNKSIRHKRRITKMKNKEEWIVEDTILNKPEATTMKQIFHPSESHAFSFESMDENNQEIKPGIKQGFQSNYYGVKDAKRYFSFESDSNFIKTTFTIQ